MAITNETISIVVEPSVPPISTQVILEEEGVEMVPGLIVADENDTTFDSMSLNDTFDNMNMINLEEENRTEMANGPFVPNRDDDKQKSIESNDHDSDDDSVVLGPIEFFRKSIVAVTGTAMLGVGAVLVPAPVPLGIPVIAGGLALLSTEFPESVDKVKETTRQKLVDALEKADENDKQNRNNNPSSDDTLENNDKEKKQSTNDYINTFQANVNKQIQDKQRDIRNKVLPWLRNDKSKKEVSSLNEPNSLTSTEK